MAAHAPSPAAARAVVHLSFGDDHPHVWAEGLVRHDAAELARWLGGWPQAAAPDHSLALWLPAAGTRPLPSPEAAVCLGQAAPSGRAGVALRRFEHPALRAGLAGLAAEPRPSPPGCVWGGEWAAWDALVELARALWEHGSVLPALRPTAAGYRCAWRGVLDDPALAASFAGWAAAVPGVLLAAGEPTPTAERSARLRGLLDAVVDALAEAVASGAPGPQPPGRGGAAEAERALLAALGCRPRPPLASSRASAGLRRRLDAWARSFEPAEAAEHALTVRLDLEPGRPGGRLLWSVTRPAASGPGPAVLPWRDAAAAGWVGPGAFRDRIAGEGPVTRRLQAAAPVDALALTDEELGSFLSEEARQLHRQGVRVLLPRELVRQSGALRLKARLGPAPQAGVGLQAIYGVEWEVLLAGCRLTVEDLLRLAEQQRPLVELHGCYVQVTPGELSAAARLVRLAERRGLPLALLLERSLARERGAGPVLDLEVDASLQAVLAPAFGGTHTPPPVEPPPGLRAELRPYQRDGFRWLTALAEGGFGALLADEMGLGKTVQVLALLLRRRLAAHGPSLVVAPTSVISGWLAEIARFAPDLRVIVYHGARRALPADRAFDLAVTSYGVLARDREALVARAWDCVVLDEAQWVKNPVAEAGRAARTLQAAVRVALTGTPLENRLADLWSLFAFLNPGYLGGLRAFHRRYAAPIERYGDAAAQRELRARLAPFLLRRTKSDPGVAPELPPRLHKLERVTAGTEQLALYRATLDWLARRLESADREERRGLVLGALTRLKTILDHPALAFREPGPLDASRSGKCLRLLELVGDAVAGGDKVLVYTQFASFARRLAPLLANRLGVPAPLLWGGQRRPERDAAIEAFRRTDGPCAMVLSLRAGGVGLNLPEATRVVHVDRWWNPAVEDQATGRAHRIGQRCTVVVHEMLTVGTIEQRVHEMLAQKRHLAAGVVGGATEWLLALDDRTLLDTLAPAAPSEGA